MLVFMIYIKYNIYIIDFYTLSVCFNVVMFSCVQIVHLTMNSTEVSCSEIANSFLSLKSFFKQTQSVSSVNFTKDELLMCLQSNFDSIISSLDEIKRFNGFLLLWSHCFFVVLEF